MLEKQLKKAKSIWEVELGLDQLKHGDGYDYAYGYRSDPRHSGHVGFVYDIDKHMYVEKSKWQIQKATDERLKETLQKKEGYFNYRKFVDRFNQTSINCVNGQSETSGLAKDCCIPPFAALAWILYLCRGI